MDIFDYIVFAIGLIAIYQIIDYYYPKQQKKVKVEDSEKLMEANQKRKERNSEGVFLDRDLIKYDGIQNPEIYISVKGAVFDVTKSKDFCRGGIYEILAGQECSVNFAKMVVDPKYFYTYFYKKLTPEEEQQLEAAYLTFCANYKIVGHLKSIQKKFQSQKQF